ncbi:MAG: hypothetical protein MJ172_04565 [Clostridia bacterium]|nr:hypothetical protein [Clostridia bacterium]
MLNINDDLMNKLERISKHKNIDIDTLLNEVLSIGIDNYDTQESGGLVLRLPNPQISNSQIFHIKEDEFKEFISILKSVYKLNKSGYDIPVFSLANYLEQRVFTDSVELKAQFENYFYNCIAYTCDNAQENISK